MIEQVVKSLKADGYMVYGLETGTDTHDIAEVDVQKLALVLGNEVEGIDKQTLALLDGKLEILMQKKRSLNVSVASGVAMYVLTNSRPIK
jgi:tRNA G18 (ribose-2'-O)-methylase SpoU